jgi:hypothetical protein
VGKAFENWLRRERGYLEKLGVFKGTVFKGMHNGFDGAEDE